MSVRFRVVREVSWDRVNRVVPSRRARGPGADVVAGLKGKADVRMSTDEILALTRKPA